MFPERPANSNIPVADDAGKLYLEIDITEGNREPLPIAITEFFHDTDSILEDQNIPSNIRKVIADDLERSGLFLSVDENAFIQKNRAMHLNPRFADWRLIKAQ